MGVAILLGDGAPALTHLGPRHPMLTPERLVLFGFNPVGLAQIEEQRIADYGLSTWPVHSVAGQPAQAAAEAWAALASRAESVLLHFDVDAIDSTDLPLANYPHSWTAP